MHMDLTQAVPHQPPPDGPASPFWLAAREERLTLPRCTDCGAMRWYLFPNCLACGSDSPEIWVGLSGEATLFTWTRVARPFVPAPGPFHVGLLECVGAKGARLVAPLVGEQSPRIGARMQVEFVHLETHSIPVFRQERSNS
jgi:uncharacterized protein